MKYFYIYIFVILFYFFNSLIDTFSDWKAKWVMDLKFISSDKLFLFYGILGLIIYSIICTITTLKDYSTVDNKHNLFKLDNFVTYFNEFTITNCILMILSAITFVLEYLYYLLVIEYLTPFHVISMPTIYLFFNQLVLGIYIIKNKDKFKTNVINIILEIMACLFVLIAFSIFLEFIELNFCLCNHNLKRYIVQRSIFDINDDNKDESILSEEDKIEENKKEGDILENELLSLSIKNN